MLVPQLVKAQPSFSTIVEKQTISINDVLQVQFILENATAMEGFRAPVFRDFLVMHGPVETTGMSLVNGQLSQYKAMTYILRPQKLGRITITGATATINGRLMQSNNVVIEVTDAPAPSPNKYPINPGIPDMMQRAEEDYLLEPGQNAADKIRNNLLVRLEVDKTSAFIGEPIVATYKLYTRLRSESRVSKRPSMNGFSVYDMVAPDGGGASIETFNGLPYQVHIIRKTQLFPLQEGSFVLEPVELQNTVRFLRRKSSDGMAEQPRSSLERMFDDLLTDDMGNWEEHHITLSSQPLTITVNPLPEGAPAGFNGAVGNFTLKATLNDSTVAAGENASLDLRIEGSGNIPLVNAPSWNLPDSFLVYDPLVKEDINKVVAPMTGSKYIVYTFTPEKSGTFNLPGISFSFFDPISKAYRTVETDSLRLTVTPGINRKINLPVSAIDGSANDRSSYWLIWLLALMLALIIFLAFYGRKKKKDKSELARVEQELLMKVETDKKIVAPSAPTDPLLMARKAMKENDGRNFYLGIEKGLWEVISFKMKLQRSAQQKPLVLELLALRGLAEKDISVLKEIWDKCEWALYVPESSVNIDASMIERTEALMAAIRVI